MSFGDEYFPWATFFILLINVFAFVVSERDPSFFFGTFGFVPKFPKPASFITYMFIHMDFVHLFGNMIFLIPVGLVLEEVIGKGKFILCYLISGVMAVPFDWLGRFAFNVPLDFAFVGASGAIFGVFTVATILKPMEKLPTFLTVSMVLPLLLTSFSFVKFEIIKENPIIIGLVVTLSLFFLVSIFMFVPLTPFVLGFPVFLVFNFLEMFLGYDLSVSNIGHVGGVVGGMISFYFMKKR